MAINQGYAVQPLTVPKGKTTVGRPIPADARQFAEYATDIPSIANAFVGLKVLVWKNAEGTEINKWYRVTAVNSLYKATTYEEDKSGTDVSLNTSTRQLTVAGTNITIPNATTVTDNLTSTSTTNALSAKQGKVLNDKMGTVKCSLVNAIYGKSFTTEAQADAYLDSLSAQTT